MASYTLTGDFGNLLGGELTSPSGYRAQAWITPVNGVVADGGDVMIGSTPIPLTANDSFSIIIPAGAYTVRVRYYDVVEQKLVDWNSSSFALGANADLSTLIVGQPFSVARRGGQYRGTRTGWTQNTVHTISLVTTVSGESAFLSGGDFVVPTGAEGVWALTALWEHTSPASGRNFVDLDVRAVGGGSSITLYRGSLAPAEDRTTLTVVRAMAVGQVVRMSIFSADATNTTAQTVTLDAYRISV